VLQEAEVGNDGMIALVDPADGRVRACRGPLRLAPNTNIAAIPNDQGDAGGTFGRLACVSATDSATRLHTCSRTAGRDLVLIAAMEQEAAMRLATRMKWHSTVPGSPVSSICCCSPPAG
jgi:hypothetical protein